MLISLNPKTEAMLVADYAALAEKYVLVIDNSQYHTCLLYTSPSPRDVEESRMPSSA